MKYASNFDRFRHDLVAFTKEYWFEVVAFCLWMSLVFWVMIAAFNW